MRIFGDVRAFECQQCDFTVLLGYPFEISNQATVSEAAE